ncbi:MAG TPA: hypothetical protein VFU14_14540 [Acidimicrobiales bacterium]|nr:hypothetical protein [Acidimicrobiales bacterium]
MRRLLASSALALLAIGFPLAAGGAEASPPDRLVRASFVDHPRGHLGEVKPEDRPGGGGPCSVPASDLCTDFKDGRLRWADPSVAYRVNVADAPEGTLTAVQDGFDAWEDEVKSEAVGDVYGVDASTIDYRYDGPSSATGASFDGSNVVSFTSLGSSCAGCLAVTTYWYWLGTRTLAEFDITVNTDYSWATSGAATAYDVQNVVTHEVGHTLVLGDLYKRGDAALTMYGYAGLGEVAKRDLGAGDVLGLRKAYPTSP